MPVSLPDIVQFLNETFAVDRYPASEQGGIYVPGDRPIQRIGLALEPPPHVGNWVRQHKLDALWLHRPWQLNQAALPPGVGVLYHHLPFDETLTTGYNVPLAAALGFSDLELLGYKTAPDPADAHLPKRPIGMIGDAPERTYAGWLSLIRTEFGGYERAGPGPVRTHQRVAVVGAMNPALVQEAHERGVGLYLTGEYRNGTQPMVDQTGMTVIAIGHCRTEEWGLRVLASLLRAKWAGLEVMDFV